MHICVLGEEWTIDFASRNMSGTKEIHSQLDREPVVSICESISPLRIRSAFPNSLNSDHEPLCQKRCANGAAPTND